MDSAQITGSTSSYARKYALNGLFAIDDSKDPDTNEHRKESDAKSKAGSKLNNTPDEPSLTDEQISIIEKELERTGIDAGIILDTYHVNTFNDMKKTQFDNLMKRFSKTASKGEK